MVILPPLDTLVQQSEAVKALANNTTEVAAADSKDPSAQLLQLLFCD